MYRVKKTKLKGYILDAYNIILYETKWDHHLDYEQKKEEKGRKERDFSVPVMLYAGYSVKLEKATK